MTQDERMLILQMVAEKKITVNEAVELLKAIEPAKEYADAEEYAGQAPAGAATGAGGAVPGAEEVAASGAAAGTRPGAGSSGAGPHRRYGQRHGSPFGEGFGAGFGAGYGSGLSSFIDDVLDKVSGVFGDTFGNRYEFPSELTGEFTAPDVALRIATGNGRVDVETWDQPGWRAQVVVKARGATEEDARNRARDAYTVESDGSFFELQARRFDWGDISVHVCLQVPKDHTYRLETRTGNGHIELTNLSLRDGQITTGNGRVNCIGGQADSLRLQSGNGAVEVEMDVAELEAGTGNGSLTVRPYGDRPRNIRLSTGNGSIRMDTSRLPVTAAYRIEADTAMGGCDVSLPNLNFEQDSRAVAHKRIVATSRDFASSASPVAIKARTGMGSISIF